MNGMMTTVISEPSAVELSAVELSAVKPSAVKPSAAEPSAAEPSAANPAAPHVVEQLRQKIRRVETLQRVVDTQAVSTGIPAIDRLLPEGGYPRGTIIEWLSPAAGCGAEWLALHTASRAAANPNLSHRTANDSIQNHYDSSPARSSRRERGPASSMASSQNSTARPGVIVVIDPEREFFPPAARALGIRNDQLIVIQSAARNELFWAIDQTLRCSAVAAVVVLGSQSPPVTTSAQRRRPAFLEQVDERWLRRFQLSAEQSGALGLFVRPIAVARQPSWCEVQWRVAVPPLRPGLSINTSPSDLSSVSNNPNHWRRFWLQLLKCRGAAAGQQLQLAWNTYSGEVQTLRPTRWLTSGDPHRMETNNANKPAPSEEDRRCG